MWQQYRKRFFVTQVFIWTVCAVGLWVLHMHPFVLLMALLMMQLGAVIGTWWSAHLVGMFEPEQKLPLDK